MTVKKRGRKENLTNAGKGRPKGVQNKSTREMKAWALAMFQSSEWQESARKRILAGKAPHLEAHCLQVLMPKVDKLDVTHRSLDLSKLSEQELATVEHVLLKAAPVEQVH